MGGKRIFLVWSTIFHLFFVVFAEGRLETSAGPGQFSEGVPPGTGGGQQGEPAQLLARRVHQVSPGQKSGHNFIEVTSEN